MRCPACRSTAIRDRPEPTAQGYRRFCCRCGKQFNERSAGVLNEARYPSDIISLVVFWRLRYKLSLRDLAEMFLTRGFIFTCEAVREWEARLTPALAENLRRKREGQSMKRTSECVANAVSQSRDRSRRRPGRRHAEQVLRFGCRQGILSVRQDGHRCHAGTGSRQTAMTPIRERSG
jgi:hypothetical protein